MLATSMLRHLRKFHAGVFSGGQDFLLLEARDSASHGAEAEDAETRERRARFDAAERALSWMTEFCLDEEGCAPNAAAQQQLLLQGATQSVVATLNHISQAVGWNTMRVNPLKMLMDIESLPLLAHLT